MERLGFRLVHKIVSLFVDVSPHAIECKNELPYAWSSGDNEMGATVISLLLDNRVQIFLRFANVNLSREFLDISRW